MNDMADGVDKKLFDELSSRDPDKIATPPFCRYDEIERCYCLTLWQNEYRVYPEQARILPQGKKGEYDFFYVFLVNYLLSEKNDTPTGVWISEKDLPGGTTFFRGPHAIPTQTICSAFANDQELLKRKCEDLGGEPLQMGDFAYSFRIIGSVSVALVFWLGDDEFPAEAKLLFDSSIAEIYQLDTVYALLCDVCKRIAQ